MSTDQSRKVLEDIQRQKSKLLKDGAAASLGIGVASSSVSSIPSYSAAGGGLPSASSSDVHMSPAMRNAMLVLQQANSSSFGYFVAQDSHFGNSILPVLPRLDPSGGPSTTTPHLVSSPLTPTKTENCNKMKLKEIESFLTQCDVFDQPKVALEQYATSAHIASRMVYAAKEYIEGGLVCDLGSGCGVLSIGSVLVGAELVYGFEIDADAIEIAQQNVNDILKEDDDSGCAIEFIQGEIGKAWKSRYDNGPPVDVCDNFHEMFDVVLMNPPFGTKNTVGADFKFLNRALSLVKPGGHVYSLHKSSTRDFFMKKAASGPPEIVANVKAEVLAKIRYDLPKCYKFHKKSSVDIEVDFWHFEKMK